MAVRQSPFPAIVCVLAATLLSAVANGAVSESHTYIVYLEEKLHHDPDVVTTSHHRLLASLLGSKEAAKDSMLYTYTHAFSGFAASLSKSQVKELKGLPGVIGIKRSRMYHVHTTRSWDFLELASDNPLTSELLQKSNYGEGVIIGVVDSGICSGSRSFSDKGYGPIPSRWNGTCQLGEAFEDFHCNRKIIGARWYPYGFDNKTLMNDFLSPRDNIGHGTHTASTAAGSAVNSVSYMGLGAGTARGGAPKARLAIYKACWGPDGKCNEASVLKAIDDAIHDGVDVLSLSLSGNGYPWASLRAAANGISVVFSAGNDGPVAQTVQNALPWVTTVAATTIDRSFPAVITLGNNKTLVGQSIFNSWKTTNFTGLIFGGSCEGPLNDTDIFADKIMLCYLPPKNAYSPMIIQNIKNAGARGLIFSQYTVSCLGRLADCNELPCVLVDYTIGTSIFSYAVSTSDPIVRLSPPENAIGTHVLAPKVVDFSSRGPSPDFPDLLKPDIGAPGANILAAVGANYELFSGTSMSCPHVSGILTLLKAVYPDWSPAALKSAIITTASSVDRYELPIESEGRPRKIADPFDYGGGHIQPNKAADPGLIFDIAPGDYFDYISCSLIPLSNCTEEAKPLYFLNLPSISISELKTSETVSRTVTNVGQADATYKVEISPPPGVAITVKPSVLKFSAKEKVQNFKVNIKALHKVQGDFRFGSITWNDGGKHSVKMQIAVRVVIRSSYADMGC